MTTTAKRMLLVDASPYIFRGYYAIPETVSNNRDEPVNAVYGFATVLAGLLRETRARHMVLAFDESLNSSFRNRIFPAYKANREAAPEELKRQFRWCKQLGQAMGIQVLASRRYEADDLLASVAALMRKKHFSYDIVTSDKDLGQLLQQRDILWDYARQRRLNSQTFRKHMGVKPSQVADYLALAGDAVDNIPGVPGIGAKTAAALLALLPDLDAIYDNLEKVSAMPIRGIKRVRQQLENHREQAYLCQQLTCLSLQAKVATDSRQYLIKAPVMEKLDRLAARGIIGNRLRQQLLNAHPGYSS
jgi:5'-3' exonuclease